MLFPDGPPQFYLLSSSFLVDYVTMSQQERTLQCLLPACLAQGESDAGQTEDTALSAPLSEIRSTYQKLKQLFQDCSQRDKGRHEMAMDC